MKPRCFDHIDLRVKNREEAQRFYAQVLPALGLPHDASGERWGAFDTGDPEPAEFFGFTEGPRHEPNGSRIAFWAETRAHVDEVAKVVRAAGGRNLEGPELCVEYTPGYYAFFFEDPSGNKLEVCSRASGIVAE